MSDALVKSDKPQGSRALELLSRGLGGIESKGALVKALLPNIPQLRLPFNRPPPNIIRVILDQGSSSPSPGDEIHGIVRLMVSEPIAVRDIVISLTGIAKAKALRPSAESLKSVYRSDVQLLERAIEIDLEASILAPKRYEWPFEVAIPRMCTISESPFDENTRRFNSNLTQPLPPVFTDKNLREIRSKCSVEYHVTAKLKSKREKQQDIHHRIPISILANDTRAIMASDTSNTSLKRCTFKFRSAALTNSSTSGSILGTPDGSDREEESSPARSPTKKPSSPGLRTRFKSSLMPFTLPSYSFDLDLIIPKSGRLSEPLPISLKFSWHLPKSSNSGPKPPMPSVSLNSLSINLMSRTLMRALPEDTNVGAGFVLGTGSLHQVWRSKPIVIAELKEPIKELPDALNLSKLFFVRPHHFQPAFRTINIAREYVLQIVCEMTSCGENFEARYEVEQFTIVAEGGLEDDFEERKAVNKEEQEDLGDLNSDAESEAEEEEEKRPQAETISNTSTVNVVDSENVTS
ncbi:hypothetical protein MMC10_001288 [Thelotrema lepadinum]|nr:hypothetical protein [Thelotrema lepadinum]